MAMEWREQHKGDYIPDVENLKVFWWTEVNLHGDAPIPVIEKEVWLVGNQVSLLQPDVLDLMEEAFLFQALHLSTFKRTVKKIDREWLQKYYPVLLNRPDYEDLLSEEYFKERLAESFDLPIGLDFSGLLLLRYDTREGKWYGAKLPVTCYEDLLDSVYSAAASIGEKKASHKEESSSTRRRGLDTDDEIRFSFREILPCEFSIDGLEDEISKMVNQYPLRLIEALIKKNLRLSRIEVDWQYRILLPEFKRYGWDGEITLDPLPKTILIFFLRHPELRLQHYQLGEYEQEFLSIYMKFTNVGGDHMDKIERSIHNLLFEKKNSPFSTNVNDIKQAFQAHLHEWEAENYYVQKNKEGYGISLPPELISLPKV